MKSKKVEEHARAPICLNEVILAGFNRWTFYTGYLPNLLEPKIIHFISFMTHNTDTQFTKLSAHDI